MTEQTLKLLQGLMEKTALGIPGARDALENELLQIQIKKYRNPFVSCSRLWSIAEGFAKKGDTPGFVLTIHGECDAGVDISELRAKYQLGGDAVDHLEEFGIPRRLGPPFVVKKVQKVYPFGRAAEDVY
ncbi:hypothetical protein ACIOK4_24985 [Streptomyces bottropensis]|jgi:hypothetical protein|uniref:hypothetical protein n=1 Tax=Streptomyces TaxID=1883 RepID=UPI0033A24E0C